MHSLPILLSMLLIAANIKQWCLPNTRRLANTLDKCCKMDKGMRVVVAHLELSSCLPDKHLTLVKQSIITAPTTTENGPQWNDHATLFLLPQLLQPATFEAQFHRRSFTSIYFKIWKECNGYNIASKMPRQESGKQQKRKHQGWNVLPQKKMKQ